MMNSEESVKSVKNHFSKFLPTQLICYFCELYNFKIIEYNFT